MRKPTIYDIARATEEKQPHFFTRKTLKFFNQTMRDFSVWKQDGRVFITAPMKDGRGHIIGYTHREFTGDDLIHFNPEEV